MRWRRDARFEEERRRYAFRGSCEDCALYLVSTERCAHRFPNWDHRRARLDGPSAERCTDMEEGDVVFCKEFELA